MVNQFEYRKNSIQNSKKIAGRFLVQTKEGGLVALDEQMYGLYEEAHGHHLEEILEDKHLLIQDPTIIRAGIAILAEAGLLCRQMDHITDQKPVEHPVIGKKVSVIIVAYRGMEWIKSLIPTILNQIYSPIEIILVENGPTDGTGGWIKETYRGDIRVIHLEHSVPFAKATNCGIQQASGEYFCILNQDILLKPDTIHRLVVRSEDNKINCGAVAAKLLLTWAPNFLNGLGNIVGPSFYGTDLGFGQIDLGQLDAVEEVPSACFATTLISRQAWEAVGGMDENYGMYYEDADWCYQARNKGYLILANPKAEVFHAFGGSNGKNYSGLSEGKVAEVTYSRLRFATKLVPLENLIRFLGGYLFEDVLHIVQAVFRLQFTTAGIYLAAWVKWLRDLPEIIVKRKKIGINRTYFCKLQHMDLKYFRPIQWRGLPEITENSLVEFYLPMILAGETRPLPEFENFPEMLEEMTESEIRKNQNMKFRKGKVLEGNFAATWEKVRWRLISRY
ncbi:MAG TPA: glycosyltransferase family 2 protein [Anaerolineaceae bacterium]|nr:glycosyltransferase family 2 protein [Anaerolineaceae bacterium]